MDFSAFWQGNIFENLQRQKEYTEVKKLADKAEEQKDSIYTALETLCICFPGRISGSDALESSLDYLFEWGIRNLHGCSRMTQEEVCDIPVWQRGDPDMEKLQLIIQPGENVWPVPNPLNRRLGVLAIGMSIGTSKSGVQGDISIVADFDELATRGRNGELKGKIVLLDYRKFRTYGDHAALRACGANEATRYGALAVLIRSLTPNDSVSGIHTGSQSRYDESAANPSQQDAFRWKILSFVGACVNEGTGSRRRFHFPVGCASNVIPETSALKYQALKYPTKSFFSVLILTVGTDSIQRARGLMMMVKG